MYPNLPLVDIEKLKDKNTGPELEDKLFKLNEQNKLRLLSMNGGVDTGGGTIVTTVHGKKGLIDYFTHAPVLFGNFDQRPRLYVPNTKALSRGGIDKIDFKTLGAWHPLLERIEKWKISSPLISEYLELALNNIPVYFVKYKIEIVDNRYFIPENLKTEIASLNTIALYRKDLGLIISQPEFEALTYEDQLGLLMKEVLRHIQITYETDLTAEQMQSLNALLAMGPQGNETLDSAKYLSGKMLTKILDEGLLEIFKENLFNHVYNYNRRNQLRGCHSNMDVKDVIENLNNRLERVENAYEKYEVRILLRRSFRVLDWSIQNNLAYNQALTVLNAAQSISMEKIKLDVFINKTNASE